MTKSLTAMGQFACLAILWCFSSWSAASCEQDDCASPLTVASIAERIQSGELSSSPLFLPEAERRVVFANTHLFAPTRVVPVGEQPSELISKPRDFGSLTYELEGEKFTFSSFLEREPLMGLMIVSGDDVLFEHYAADHSASDRWISFSVTKSVTSLLIGAAIRDGYIGSLDDSVVDYLPRLAGSAYASVRIRDVLQMASGVQWNEDYEDPDSDVSVAGQWNGVALTNHLQKLERVAEPGTTFLYNTGESNLTGEVLRSAIGNNASNYLAEKIWLPFGMEYEATWLLDNRFGRETGGCCISASLRDYARLGQFALRDGVLPDGTQTLPKDWMSASTTPSAGREDYGYLWWLYGGDTFAASGIFGQKIYVDPASDLVVAVHSNAAKAVGSVYHAHLSAVLAAISSGI